MTLSDRVIDAWVWFADDPEESVQEMCRAAREVAVLIMELWWLFIVAGLLGLRNSQKSWRQAVLSLFLGLLGLALWLTPVWLAILVLEVLVS